MIVLHARAVASSAFSLKGVENGSIVRAEGCAKFGLLLQDVSWSLAAELVDLFVDIMEHINVRIIHDYACSHLVMTTKGLICADYPKTHRESILCV